MGEAKEELLVEIKPRAATAAATERSLAITKSFQNNRNRKSFEVGRNQPSLQRLSFTV